MNCFLCFSRQIGWPFLYMKYRSFHKKLAAIVRPAIAERRQWQRQNPSSWMEEHDLSDILSATLADESLDTVRWMFISELNGIQWPLISTRWSHISIAIYVSFQIVIRRWYRKNSHSRAMTCGVRSAIIEHRQWQRHHLTSQTSYRLLWPMSHQIQYKNWSINTSIQVVPGGHFFNWTSILFN